VGFTANILTGIILDLNFSQSAKSKFIYVAVAIFITASWVWNSVIQAKLSAQSESPSFDLGDGPFFNSAFTVYMFFKFFYEVLQTYVYWFMGEMKGAQRNGDIARTTGILRSWESIGSTIAYAIGATAVSDMNQMIVGFALWGFTVPCTLLAVFGTWDNGKDDDDGEGQESDTSLEAQRINVVGEAKA
jgi:hypothetical protein